MSRHEDGMFVVTPDQVIQLNEKISGLTTAIGILSEKTESNTRAVQDSRETSKSGDDVLRIGLSSIDSKLDSLDKKVEARVVLLEADKIRPLETRVTAIELALAQAKGMSIAARILVAASACIALPCVGWVGIAVLHKVFGM